MQGEARVCEEEAKSWRSPCAARGDYSTIGNGCQRRVQSVRGSPSPPSSPLEGREIRMHPLVGSVRGKSGLILSCGLRGVEACPERSRRRCPEGVSKGEPSGAQGRNLVPCWGFYSGLGP